MIRQLTSFVTDNGPGTHTWAPGQSRQLDMTHMDRAEDASAAYASCEKDKTNRPLGGKNIMPKHFRPADQGHPDALPSAETPKMAAQVANETEAPMPVEIPHNYDPEAEASRDDTPVQEKTNVLVVDEGQIRKMEGAWPSPPRIMYFPDDDADPYARNFALSNPVVARICALTLVFAVGAIAGWLYETILDLALGHGLVLQSQFVLPWCPIYGIGCVILEMLAGTGFSQREVTPKLVVKDIVICALVTTFAELLASYALEAYTGHFPWDYSQYPLNFQGRVALPFTAIFTIGGTLMLLVINPRLHFATDASGWVAAGFALMIWLLLVIEAVCQYLGTADAVRSMLVHHGNLLLKGHPRVSVQAIDG